MPTQKDFKRLVRARMRKTGESYTAARARLIDAGPRRGRAAPRASSPAVAHDRSATAARGLATLAGMSDAAVSAKTGRSWSAWARALDRAGARDWPHRRIAEFVRRTYGTPDWWAQAVTVGYERIRGLRAMGQRRDGSFEAHKSRTFAAPAKRLFDAFTVARIRSRWLPGTRLTVRKATPGRSVRIAWADGTSVEVSLVPRDAARCAAQVQHRKLPDRAAALRMKAFWGERLGALAELLRV